MSIAIVTQTSNKRAAHCAFCGTMLLPGQGHKVERAYSSPYYLCQACHDHRQALNEMRPELYRVLRDIKDWCIDRVTLNCGWSASNFVEVMVERTDLKALEIAREIRDLLPDLKECTYGSVIALAKQVIAKFEASEECTCRPDSDLACPSCSGYINRKAAYELPY